MVEQHVPVRPISSVIPTKRYAERGARKGFFDLLGLSMTVSDGCREPFQLLSSLRFYLKNEYPARRRDGFLRAYRPMAIPRAVWQVRLLQQTCSAFSSPEFF